MASATLLRSARFIDAISEKRESLQAETGCCQSTPSRTRKKKTS
jgi:hypothetical protein